MKLIQANIWGGRIVFKLPEFINAQNPDIVCMQEVWDIPGTTSGMFESLDYLKIKGDFSEKFIAPKISFNFMNRKVKYGNALLSKLPLENHDNVFVMGEYIDNYDEVEHGPRPVLFQHATTTINGHNLHIINYHGEFIRGSKAGTDDTVRQVQMIADYAAQFADEPVIITGDFNLAPDSESIRVLNERFRNLPVEYGFTSTYSTILHAFNVICDYIFVNEHVQVNSLTMPDDVVSDHKPLVLEFDV